jgi:prepilin-type N-terminal cleavage/methylation domain-containing protein
VRRRDQAGFTLIELLIVLSILSVLTAILIPNFLRARASGVLATCQLDMRTIAVALDLYYNEQQTYPPSASWQTDLVSGGYIRSVPKSPADKGSYGYVTDVDRFTFVLSDGPDKYLQAGVAGYIVYTPTQGLAVGLPSVPTP